ncbi:hypothetical protein HF521_016851 [Silurus meridionalis]|uniref:Uncharacterized protein n=1 Tax=Silurus meridionalis TaxID=175797 RepID=A0A8T0BRP7_SILME|nr:hypothetical protein HF521_016851 [Silurus meridionalis]
MVYEDRKVFANEGNRLHLTNNNLKEPLNMASSSQEPKSTIELELELQLVSPPQLELELDVGGLWMWWFLSVSRSL